MNILYFVVGGAPFVHLQAQYALRTIYARAENNDNNIYILTDAPALYKNIPFVKVETITEQEIKDWQGNYRYFFRIKINAIRKFINSHDDKHLLFMDTDTYVYGDINEIKRRLDKGIGLMHKDEGDITNMKGASYEMFRQTNGKSYGGITIDQRFHMWNSGVFAIPQPRLHIVMDKYLTICDDFLADGVTCFNLEQWSGAIALIDSTNRIEESYMYIGHYWHHKEVWTQYITSFLLDSYRSGRAIDKEIEIIKRTNFPLMAFMLKIKRCIMKHVLYII